MNQTQTYNQKNSDEFIMLPTVDFCFKELMQGEKVRKGIIAALLHIKPQEIAHTELMPTMLRKQHMDDKYGILDVRVKLIDGTQMDFEMQVAAYEFWKNRSIYYVSKMYTEQIKQGEDYDKLQKCIQVSILNFSLYKNDKKCYRRVAFCDTESGEEYSDLLELYILELSKLPAEQKNEASIIQWMRFLSGTCEEDFRKMAEKDEYIGEAYELLKNLSADEAKRIEYEAREKAMRDYNSLMHSAERKGFRLGREEGVKELLTELVNKKIKKGKNPEQIAEELEEEVSVIEKIISEIESKEK